MKITADFTRQTGKIKPMHGVGQPPFYGENFSLFSYLTDAGIPYTRLHDVGGWLGGGLYVDIPNLFRDFDADENDPDSYDFAFTDRLMRAICDAGTEPFFRLGVTIENSWALRSYRVFPPKDMHKWARICEHVIRHYNEGWANGYHMGITYWEIWNEPDDCRITGESPMWQGTKEEYYTLYEITANHLKACFGDTIKVGGYAACGFYARDCDPNADGNMQLHTEENGSEWQLRTEFFLQFMHGFFRWILSEEHKAPIDFFSWHTYEDVFAAVEEAKYIRRVMNHYGLQDVPDILDEWNTCHHVKKRATPFAAARAFAFMLAMQKESVAEMNFYDARIGPSEYGGLFDPSTWEPYLAYYAFLSYNTAYRLENEIYNTSDDGSVFTLGAAGNGGRVLLLANIGDEKMAELSICGADLAKAEVLRIDASHRYSPTGESIARGTIRLPADSCVEIRFL